MCSGNFIFNLDEILEHNRTCSKKEKKKEKEEMGTGGSEENLIDGKNLMEQQEKLYLLISFLHLNSNFYCCKGMKKKSNKEVKKSQKRYQPVPITTIIIIIEQGIYVKSVTNSICSPLLKFWNTKKLTKIKN